MHILVGISWAEETFQKFLMYRYYKVCFAMFNKGYISIMLSYLLSFWTGLHKSQLNLSVS
jgi:hypothetical protein